VAGPQPHRRPPGVRDPCRPGRSGRDHPHYLYKLAWLDALAAQTERWAAHGPLLVGGDFNVAPLDLDCWNPRGFRGRTHVSPPERERIAALTTAGGGPLVDLWRTCHGDEAVGFTWWNYHPLGFRQGQGLRIDLLLASEDLAARGRCEVDLDERAAEGPSDHAPLVATLHHPR
jgi:exodeoxyribonuclease-3